MKKRVFTVAISTLLGSLALIKLKEKRSYKSILMETTFKASGMKKTFENEDDARKALEDTKDTTAGKYEGTNYNFKNSVHARDDSGSLIYYVNDKRDINQKTIIFIHGGAWFQNPLEYHFQFIDSIASELQARVIMPIYPKVPHRDYKATFNLLERLYTKLLSKETDASQISFMGDSAGG